MKLLKIPLDRVSAVRQAFIARAEQYEAEPTNGTNAQRQAFADLAVYFRQLAVGLDNARGPGRAG